MMRNIIAGAFVFFLIAGASNVCAADAIDAVDQIVADSTSTPKRTIEDLYRGDRYRDPFAKLSLGESSVAREEKEFSLETFSIHALKLKGILKEKGATYAILVEEESGMGFMLRKRRLYTYKNEVIPGVSGRINVVQKSVTLLTDEKDVQTLRLGEEEEDEEEGEDEDQKDEE